MPTNSVIVTPPFASSTTATATTAQPTPNFSRIRSSRPRPVAAPSRVAISWTIASDRVMSTIIQSRS
jgi:hypothetical protein